MDHVVAELTPLYGEDCPVVVVARASWPDEQIIHATLGTIEARLAEQAIERTAMIFVGPSLGQTDFAESALYNASYQRRFRGRGA